MTLQELRFIVALAREKHFGKASEACFVSQPTLSVAVRKLEKELGVNLFERNKSEVKITPLGKEIVERAKRVLEEAEDIKEAAKADKDQLASVLKLGAIYTVGPYLLPKFITQLSLLAPKMTLEIQENYTANLSEKLHSGELDAIIISLPYTEPGILTKLLYKEPFVVLMPANHPLAKATRVDEKELSKYNVLLLGEGNCFREQVISSCPTCFAPRKSHAGVNWKTVEGSSLETIRHMVASGMGLTILPLTAAHNASYGEGILTSRPLKGSTPYRSVALAWRKSFPRVKAIDMLFNAASQCALKGVR